MAYNGKILAKANAALSDIRQRNSEEHLKRQRIVYSAIPSVREIDAALVGQMSTLAKCIISSRSASEIAKLREENLNLQIKRAELLVQGGFSRDYLDLIYSCRLCNDTGVTKNGMCSCVKRLYNECLTKELSTLLKTGNESFESFNLSLYPEQCRSHMENVFNLAKEYADYFPDVENLLFRGAPGLGKTYLSACIARKVAENGCSVCYVSAIDVFADFDAAQFKQDEAAASRIKMLYDCDLLILDDLGTELKMPSVTSALYNIINTRVNTSKGMIINTNMSKDDILERYSPAIASRINGYFTILDFVGEDIRQKI